MCERLRGERDARHNVVTARCPASFSLTMDSPTVFRNVPTAYFDGTALTPAEQARTKAVMDEARTLPVQNLTFSDPERANGTCTYRSGPDTRVVLRTKDGKDRLDLFHKAYRLYAQLGSYDQNGITFRYQTPTSLFANIDASGPGDGASLNVRIGKATVSAQGGGAPQSANATLRVPLLDEGASQRVFLHDSDPQFPKTVVLDGATGPETYQNWVNKAVEAGYEPVTYGSPNDYVTSDPSTSICFNGPESEICGLLGGFTDNLLGDMFAIVDECQVTSDSVSFDFYMSESDSRFHTTIPRCR
jgi:hypothetical protein